MIFSKVSFPANGFARDVGEETVSFRRALSSSSLTSSSVPSLLILIR